MTVCKIQGLSQIPYKKSRFLRNPKPWIKILKIQETPAFTDVIQTLCTH